MKLLEYEAKQILRRHGAPVPSGIIITQADELKEITLPTVIKAQILKGGRGKAGGVRLVSSQAELRTTVNDLLGKDLLGLNVSALLAETPLDIARELYLSFSVNREKQQIVLAAHRSGGIDIEAASVEAPPLLLTLASHPGQKETEQLLDYFALDDSFTDTLSSLLHYLYEAFVDEDALLLEINPLVVTAQDELVCADAKMEADDAAAFRHPDWHFYDKPKDNQFVVLNEQGNIASMANGAGLAMATMDAVAAAGLTPANFFDVGGGASSEIMAASFKKMAELPNVQAIIINIFGGITRCDDVARAIVNAQQAIDELPPLYIRLTGTNEAEGHRILERHAIKTLPSLEACIAAAKKEIIHA